MIKTAGVVFDFYDDHGAFLREKLAGHKVPEAIEQATVLDPQDLSGLPDNAFAGVIRNGEETLRKYACVDKGNTIVSALYFLESQYNFPSGAKTKIANNLMSACRYFEVVPPPALAKLAAGRTLIQGDGAEIIVPRKQEKNAELTGTSLMPVTAGPAQKPRDKSKLASEPVISDPYVDVTSHVVGPRRTYDDMPDSMYAMVDRDGQRDFPLQTWDQVKTACDFFEDSWKRMHPRTRHQFCTKVAARADHIGMDASHIIRKYGSVGFAHPGEIDFAVETRRQMWREGNDDAMSLLDGLMEKQASGELEPEVFAEALFELDKIAGADRYYDKAVVDPWASTFGIIKEAAWRWASGNDVLTEDELKNFVKTQKQFLGEHFSEDVAEALCKNPVQVFDSMPLPEQRVIARLAHQQSEGGANAQIGLS